MSQYKLGFLGCGNMAKAIINGVISSKAMPASDIFAYDVSEIALSGAVEKHGLNACSSIENLCNSSDIIILAVKPNVVEHLLDDNKEYLIGKKLISIAAGFSTEKLIYLLDATTKVLRVMPNTPAMVNCGATGLCTSTTFNDDEKKFAQMLFDSVGMTAWIPEYQMDALISVSGSGPAYVFMFIQAMADAGVREGLPRQLAQDLAVQTVMGAAQMVKSSGMHPGQLQDMVCSPGGTTIEAVYALEKGGLRAAVMEAAHICAEKSRNLI